MLMKSLKDCYKLHNGVCIPCIGFGTWKISDGDVCVSAVKTALSVGYRHIDTAVAYGNEESVGLAIRQSGIPREELFITSKLWNNAHGYKETMEAFEQSEL
jgi:diketogulonate reductase-like aldo/keto reductase